MIKTWNHKGLKRFYTSGDKSGIQPEHAKRLKIILQLLDIIEAPTNMNLPGMYFHTLKGDRLGFYSVKVDGNWRIVFKYEDQSVILVDYVDYH